YHRCLFFSECVTGKFGNICEQDCSVNCKDRLCVKDSGNCTECSLGKHGASCNHDCPGYCRDGCTRDNASCIGCTTGRYGVACTSTCPVTCKDFVCGQQTGQCLDCYPGKYGVVCGADCPASCPDNICNKEDGKCLTQVNTYVIIIAVLAVVCGLVTAALITSVICQRRNREKGRNSQDKSTDQSGPDTGYSSIDHRDVEPTHVYEMVVTET
ncbi:cell death abnormality protein 1-like, partial [Argopecten irradians]|uniref:cell death abnormality protein 1-like n=1 Tax=Argopecten irradians TaxID=31199 RepID=UPI0037156FDC